MVFVLDCRTYFQRVQEKKLTRIAKEETTTQLKWHRGFVMRSY
ncbi:unnamed protein product [Tenebrio molitor]|nr:unnamed protein product [Tenebrio molitor]